VQTQTAPAQNTEQSSMVIDVRELAAMLDISEPTLRQMRRQGLVPAPIAALGPRLLRWPRKLIEDWVAAGCPQPEEGVADEQ
jgi:predicted DNA-binding transcriptional regulator AlpA